MKTQARNQDTLPGLAEVAEHPMWVPPAADEDMPRWIRAARKAIADMLIPFDGRPNSEYATEYAKSAHMLTCTRSAHDEPLWMIGQLVSIRFAHQDRFNSQSVNVILQGLCDQVVKAIIDDSSH